MKKVDGKFLLIQALIILAVSLVVSIGVTIAMGASNPVVAGFNMLPFFFVVLGLFYLVFCNAFLGGIAKKTMEQNCEKENFNNYSTFITNGSFTIGSIIRIDEETGRVAFVSYQNPHEFQMAHAKDLTNIESTYKKAPLGGTSYVYFAFSYNNKKVVIPTFTASNVYSLQSKEVLEGISKADAFCDILKNAQTVGV